LLTYRNPSSSVIILGHVTEKVVTRLQSILRVYGSRGLRIYLVSTASAKVLEALRDFILSNYTFTVEVYTVGGDQAKQIYEREGSSIVSVLASEHVLLDDLPGHLKGLVEVL